MKSKVFFTRDLSPEALEREYCFKVNNLEKSLEFCKTNGFVLISETEQIRTIYRKPDKTMARITTEKTNNGVRYLLDFKEDKLTNSSLNIREESKALVFNDLEAVYSILNFLQYSKDNTLNRKRWTFEKDNIVCEIDLYDAQSNNIVVSIEGDNHEGVDKFYNSFVKFMEN